MREGRIFFCFYMPRAVASGRKLFVRGIFLPKNDRRKEDKEDTDGAATIWLS